MLGALQQTGNVVQSAKSQLYPGQAAPHTIGETQLPHLQSNDAAAVNKGTVHHRAESVGIHRVSVNQHPAASHSSKHGTHRESYSATTRKANMASTDPLEELQAVTKELEARQKRADSPTDQFIRDLIEPSGKNKNSHRDLNFETVNAANMHHQSANNAKSTCSNYSDKNNCTYKNSNNMPDPFTNHTFKSNFSHQKPNLNVEPNPVVNHAGYATARLSGNSAQNLQNYPSAPYQGTVHHRPALGRTLVNQLVHKGNPASTSIQKQIPAEGMHGPKVNRISPILEAQSNHAQRVAYQKVPFFQGHRPELSPHTKVLSQQHRQMQQQDKQLQQQQLLLQQQQRKQQLNQQRKHSKDDVIRVRLPEDPNTQLQQQKAWARAEQFLASLKNKKNALGQEQTNQASMHQTSKASAPQV